MGGKDPEALEGMLCIPQLFSTEWSLNVLWGSLLHRLDTHCRSGLSDVMVGYARFLWGLHGGHASACVPGLFEAGARIVGC